MTDIVERLRWWAYKFCGKGVQEDDASDVMTNAIHEIEKLREALTEVMVWINEWEPAFIQDGEWRETKRMVRAALGEKE